VQTSGPQRNRRLEYSWLLDVEQILSEQLGLFGGVSDSSDLRSKLNSPRFVANSRPAVARLRRLAPARCKEGIMTGSYMGEFLYARDHVVDGLHAQGKDDSEIAQTLSMTADQVLLIRTRSREEDPDL
jgi:hypothetical protein